MGAVDEFALGIEGFVAHRIPAGEAPEIDLAALLQLLPQRLDAAHMARLGRADEIVVADVEKLRHLAPGGRDAVAEFLRRNAGGARRLLDLLAMLVAAGQEFDPIPIEPHKPRQRVARARRSSSSPRR